MSTRPVDAWRALGVLGLGLLVACTAAPATKRVFCSGGSDCATGERCVVDLVQDSTYCAQTCTRDRDCPRDQSCVDGSLGAASSTVAVCVDRLRACGTEEPCNGLDDDCDGVVDGPNCTPVTRCTDDDSCGAYRCSAPLNQASTLCVPDATDGQPYGSDCAQDADCINGVCDVGRCAPLCRGVVALGRSCVDGEACVRGVGTNARPAYNACQTTCTDPSDCTAPGTTCVWREVVQDEDVHAFVCSRPGPQRNPLGAACPRNDRAGDDTCGGGLCFDLWCTRTCDGPAADCSDVGRDAKCCQQQLRYGTFERLRYVCVRGGSRCQG